MISQVGGSEQTVGIPWRCTEVTSVGKKKKMSKQTLVPKRIKGRLHIVLHLHVLQLETKGLNEQWQQMKH